MAAITKYHELSGLKEQKFIVNSGGYKSEVRVLAGLPRLSKAVGPDPSLALAPGIFFSCDSISSTTPELLCVSTSY